MPKPAPGGRSFSFLGARNLPGKRKFNTLKSRVAIVAFLKPTVAPPVNGFRLIVFSHGFTGCNTQTKFLTRALARAGYVVFALNHKDA